MKIKLKTMQISFLLCHKFSFYHTSIPISKVEIWSPFPVMYVGRYSHTCILSVNLHREFTTIVAKPCSCCFPTYFSCYCNYETSRYICIPKDQNSAACAAFPGLQPSFSITSCDGVNRIRAEKKLKAGNWSSSSIDFKDENLSLKLLINRLKPVAARWLDLESSWERIPTDSVSFSVTHAMWNITWVTCSCTGLLTMSLLQLWMTCWMPSGLLTWLRTNWHHNWRKNTKVRAYT